ncbi:rhodanese-like domain-containing protein [Pseudoteredinibacter isoporae]|uniref:Rhodanese-related sulfurtransferase n=1 Tax=Pseudoteredinibacter isoporae TaxID=570281 RepID=A0A7X0JVF4_9GAMM|nr:rhodanese-related sulfurtransferase [Pseudoteredinibacter isoporae]NHO87557.1 rhodanese-like domain-containing protein [Pseudoteredinibacter isoporae]NIB24112.1 rhodanese-like domain-containing protein [Pseudoteredinibacter isoporae]
MTLLSKAACLFLGSLLAFSAIAEKKDAPLEVAGAETVNTDKAKELFDAGALFIDPRRDSDWAEGRIPDAVHLEMKSVFNEQSLAGEASKDEAIVFYCNGAKCSRSAKCAAKAISWGYSKVYYFRDGLPAWKAAGFPVE